MSNPQQHSASSSHTMIGSTTTFYDPDLHGPPPEPEIDYTAYVQQQFPPQQPLYPDYSTVFPPYQSQSYVQPTQYLPTPSVSPTSASGRQIAPVPRHSSAQYYELQGAVDHQFASNEPPKFEQVIGDLERTKSVGKRDRGGPVPARRKSQPKPPAKAAAHARKRPRKSDPGLGRGSSERDAEESEEEEAEDDAPKAAQRLPGACRYCKKLKMRCEFPPDSNTCRRCKSGGHQCVVEGRKPRSGPNKREYLLAQLRQKEAIIDSLLKQIHNPAHQTPLNLGLPPQSSLSTTAHNTASPEPATHKDVLAWIEKIEGASSVRAAGGAGGAGAFRLDARAEADDTFEDDGEDDDGVGAGENEAEQEAEADAEPTDKEKKSKLHSLPEEAAPLGLIATLSLRNTSPRKPSLGVATSDEASPGAADAASPEKDGENDNDVGVANATYFLPGPATNLDLRRVIVERTMPPEILVHGLVTPEDVEKLFEIFYDRINPFLSLLDPVIHTPSRTFGRCPFLFTVVCAVASRYYAPKADIYKYAMHFAKTAAATSLIDGWKSVELCQAYLLLSVYSVPARRWEEDRSWLYLGLAIRIATDLNLHQPTSTKITSEKHEREVLNRTRTWIICFNLDRSTSTQLGKPSTIKEDFIIRNSTEWYKHSPYNHPYDVHLCAYTQLLRLVTRFHDEVYSDQSVANGLNQADFYTITMKYDDQLRAFQAEAATRFEQDSAKDDPGSVFRTKLLPFIVNYSRLVMFSFGFQHAVQKGLKREDVFFQRCFDAACAVITTVVDRLVPTGYLRYAPDGHFVFASFASAFLLKLLRPDFRGIVSPTQEQHILTLVRRLIKVLGSNEIAVDDRHTPKLYSRFLANLLTRHTSRHVESKHTVPKIESSPVDAPMPSFPEPPPMRSTQLSNDLSQGLQPGPMPEPQYTQTLSLSPGRLDDMYSPSSAGGNSITEYGMEGMQSDDYLASMQAINNPMFWEHVMLPGFSWPDPAQPGDLSTMGPSGQAQPHQSADPFAFAPHDPLMQHEQLQG